MATQCVMGSGWCITRVAAAVFRRAATDRHEYPQALHLAANGGHTTCVELLLAAKANVSAHVNSVVAGTICSLCGSLFLLFIFPQTNEVSSGGLRALHLAACGGHASVMRALIRRGARLGCTAAEVENGQW